MISALDMKFRPAEGPDLEVIARERDACWHLFDQRLLLTSTVMLDFLEEISQPVETAKKICLVGIKPDPVECFQQEVGVFQISDINRVHRTGVLTWMIFEGRRGRGYGTVMVKAGIWMAFNYFNLDRVEALIQEDNVASMRVASRSGMKLEGKKNSSLLVCGERVSQSIFACWRGHGDN